MSLSIRLKFWLYDHYWWLLLPAIGLATGVLLWFDEPFPTVATVIGGILSIAYFLQKQKLEELRLFREIFKECNERYDRMNEALAKIVLTGDEKLTPEERETVVDYLNLCGEEYLYFKRGYIEPSVWQAWQNGMKAILSSPRLREVWEKEKQTGSYYDLPL